MARPSVSASRYSKAQLESKSVSGVRPAWVARAWSAPARRGRGRAARREVAAAGTAARPASSPRGRSARARERDQRLGGVDPVRHAAALGDEAKEGAGAAADIEHAPPRLEPSPLQRRLVGRELLVLAERPIVGAGAPERSPTARAAWAHGCMAAHRRSFR